MTGKQHGPPSHEASILLVTGHKYPKIGGDHLYGRSDTHRCFAIYFFNPCFRVLMAWDKYPKFHGLSLPEVALGRESSGAPS